MFVGGQKENQNCNCMNEMFGEMRIMRIGSERHCYTIHQCNYPNVLREIWFYYVGREGMPLDENVVAVWRIHRKKF